MPPPSTNKRINKGDWTQGIIQTYWGASSDRTTSKRNGAATVTNTYRCVANPDGVLGPLPALTTWKTIDIDAGTFPADLWVGAGTFSLFDFCLITDLQVTGPISQSEGTPITIDKSGSLVCIGFSFGANIDGSNDIFVLGRVYRTITSASLAAAQDIYLNVYNALAIVGRPGIIFSECRSVIDTAVATPPPPGLPEFLPPKIVISEYGRSQSTYRAPKFGNLSAAYQTAFANYYAQTRNQYSQTNTAATGNSEGSIFLYPGVSTGSPVVRTAPQPLWHTINGALNTGTAIGTSYFDMIAHQGRIVGISQLAPVISSNEIYANAAAPAQVANFQDASITYTLYPDWVLQLANIVIIHPNPENTTGYGAIGSINASQLLLIKNYAGGVVINGSLDDPTIVQLPFLESTYCLNAKGINTPIGFVYASRNGVFLWTGGEQSEKLSNQLDGRFWNDWSETNTEADRLLARFGYVGRLAYWHPWIVVPNNYFYDIRTQSWWRSDLPEQPSEGATKLAMAFADVDPVTNDLYLAPWAMRLGEGQTAVAIIKASLMEVDAQGQITPTGNQTNYASSYSWQSQPLIETELVLTSFTEIILTAQRQNTTGMATIVITLSGYKQDGTAVTPIATTITLPSNTLINQLRYRIGAGGAGSTLFNAKSVQYRIEVTNTGSAAAALIHDLDFVTVPEVGELPIVTT